MIGSAVRGLIDPVGRLIEADPALAALQREAGSGIGDPIALPPLAALARLVRRLGVTISRPVRVGDGGADLNLFVRASPQEQHVVLAIASWESAPPPSARAAMREGARTAADWTWEADAGLVLTSLSPQAGWRLGRPANTLIGQPISAAFRLMDGAAGDLPLLSALARQSRVEGQVAVLRTAPFHAYRLAAQPMLDADGHFGGFRGTAARIGDEEQAATELEPVDAPPLSGERLGGSLKRPLMHIVRQAEAIASGEGGPLRRDYVDYAADIGSAARHLMSLVDDLLDLEAVERPNYSPLAESVDLAEIARRAAGLFAVRAADAEVRIERPPAAARALATGEHRRILQIAVNIVGNAVRHSPAGGMVRIDVAPADGKTLLTVTDQGPGIAPDDQARVFDKFVRIDPSAGEGSGLGLYISRRLARAMRGDLTVDHAAGEGARFTLTLPAG